MEGQATTAWTTSRTFVAVPTSRIQGGGIQILRVEKAIVVVDITPLYSSSTPGTERCRCGANTLYLDVLDSLAKVGVVERGCDEVGAGRFRRDCYDLF